MGVLTNTRHGLWLEDSPRKMEKTMMRLFLQLPGTMYTSIRSIISVVASMGWELRQMDVKTAFLNGVIEEEVYMEQPQGFEVYGKESHVCRLKKTLYVLWTQASSKSLVCSY